VPKLLCVPSLTARHARAAFILALVVIPWVVAPRTEGPVPDRPDTFDAGAAIQTLPTIELITADRPKISPTAKRGDGLRPVSNLPPAGPALDPASSFAWLAWRSGSIGWSGPLALHLAERGPPRAVGV
jgi:hypothetical protein